MKKLVLFVIFLFSFSSQAQVRKVRGEMKPPSIQIVKLEISKSAFKLYF